MSPAVGRAEVDGVPVFVAEVPSDLAHALLIFRTGVADESPVERGINHLIEHLALHGVDRRAHDFNGSVDHLFTLFAASGEPDEIGRFLTRVAGSLAAPSTSRLATETQVLRAEAAQRNPSLVGDAMWTRFGACGFGLGDFPELYLFRVDATEVETRSHAAFTVDNAVVVLSCPPPDSLHLSDLPRGRLLPAPPAVAVEHQYPAWTPSMPTVVAMAAVMNRSIAATAMLTMFVERLHAVLRDQLGLVYDVGIDSVSISGHRAHHTIYAACRTEDAGEVFGRMQTELARLRYEGLSVDDLDHYRALLARAEKGPFGGLGFAHFVACEHLLDRQIDRPGMERELELLAPPDLFDCIEGLATDLLWLMPNGSSPSDRRLHDIPWGSGEPVFGRVLPGEGAHANLTFTIGRDGWTLSHPEVWNKTIRVDDAVAYVHWTGDGGRSLFARDGTVIHAAPTDWNDGPAVFARFDRDVDPTIVVERPDALRR